MTATPTAAPAVFNVRDYAATGDKADNAQAALQAAIDACAAAGGGQVYFPPGAYTTGTLQVSTLRGLDRATVRSPARRPTLSGEARSQAWGAEVKS